MSSLNKCDLCRRSAENISRHHLIPKQIRKKTEEDNLVYLCSHCHKAIHALFTNRELAGTYNSIESLKRSPRIVKYLNFLKTVAPGEEIPMKKSRHARKSR